ncbi:CLUMA_CG011871, isoform A [Clunio marinus]|uniref:ubiquitinyl hydrolase 1 n=1 Tax=Clunio marinus TaxID=568069 RepID=A0A1J1IE81_9DIPT|nr:CLUMA_CG011871, isoform A [Clunio marinus]
MDQIYAIVIDNVLAKCYGDDDEHYVELTKGMMVEMKDIRDRSCVVLIRDFYTKNVAYEHNLYICKSSALLQVPSEIWPFLIAVNDPYERMMIAKDKPYIEYILRLKEKSFVTVNAQYFNIATPIRQSPFPSEREPKDTFWDYQCIVQYFGPVDELGPGYFFGLELVNLDKGISPQAPEISHFASKYVPGCDPNVIFLLPVNFIRKPNLKSLRKQNRSSNNGSSVLNNIICGLKDFVKPQPKHSSSSKGSVYYYDSNNFQENRSSSSQCVDANRSLTPEPVNRDYGKMNLNKLPSSISSPNLAKQDSGSSSTGSSNRQQDLINFNEDYLKIIEDREKQMEDRRLASSRGSSGSSSANSESRTPKSKKRTLQLPNAPNREIKPSTFLRLEDRDVVVIDKHDIKEAVNNESQVIIVDPPALPSTPSENEHVDLTELLGGITWPESAGGPGTLLNSEKRSNLPSTSGNGWKTIERNKSANIASHFSNSKVRRNDNFENGYERERNFQKNKQNGQYENLDQDTSSVASDALSDCIVPSPLIDIPGSTLGLGSLVEVAIDSDKPLHGVIRWIGQKIYQDGMKMPSNGSGSNPLDLIVGIELDEPCNDRRIKLNFSDGVYNGQRCFRCSERRAIFVSSRRCTKDRRFPDDPNDLRASPSSVISTIQSEGARAFGGADCPIIEGSVPALKFVNLEDLEAQCGKFKGIQGHHNSCYLDATLFSMFTFTSVFDSLLFRPREPEDCEQYEEVQRVLREDIVNPLRKNLFVRADRVMKLRHLLDKLSSVKGLVTEEKDPEEFLNGLVAQILRAEPFLKLSSGLDTFCYQLFVEKDERLTLPNVQQLFEQSFLSSDIKLKEVPSCLIIQMPRFGKNYKMYPRILPSQVLDVTDVIEDSPRQCTICGTLAEFECRECFGVCQVGSGLESTAFCKKCLATVHSHQKRVNHKAKPLSIPHDFKIMAEYNQVPRLFMELFAVICIETSHYVTFAKTGSGLDSPWVFFDSMADRKGERDGYNIPEMVPVPDLPTWLSEDGARILHEANINDKHLPEFAKRLYCDAYLMLYQSTEMMMYR